MRRRCSVVVEVGPGDRGKLLQICDDGISETLRTVASKNLQTSEDANDTHGGAGLAELNSVRVTHK